MFKVYLPSISVDAPKVAPVNLTVNPIKVSPVFESVTLPEIFPVCWLKPAAALIINNKPMLKNLKIMLCFTLLSFNFYKNITSVLTHDCINIKCGLPINQFYVKKVKSMLTPINRLTDICMPKELVLISFKI